MNTLYLIVTLFALGALVGLYLLSFVLKKQETPTFVAILHGVFVGIALILLIYYATEQKSGLIESIILFSMAALGGLILLIRDISGKSLPGWFAMGHGLIAILGFVFLLVYTLA